LVFDKQFNKKFRKLDNSLQIEGEKKIKELRADPEKGKPMRYLSNLYELYLRMYRIFYFVDKSKKKILVLGVEHKDECDKFLRKINFRKIKSLAEENS